MPKLTFSAVLYRIALLAPALLLSTTSAQQPITIDATRSTPPPQPVQAALGTSTRPDGQTLTVNSQYLVFNGKPWLPVMGEFHYSRVPREDWEAEILKMKAGGVQIISTYIIWIHQEEIEGQFDWTGRRDLHAFVELCARHGMYVYPRIGPWAHGEARNGGLPDWVLANGPTRRNDPVYLAEVAKLYDQIGRQLKGQLWKDGGPVIGLQLENEYRGDGSPGTGSDHIRKLKQLAIAAGIDVPLYTVTGWDGASPFHSMQPCPSSAATPTLHGTGSPDPRMPPNEVYAFRFVQPRPPAAWAPSAVTTRTPPAASYRGTPFFTAEVGDGMRRHLLPPSGGHRRTTSPPFPRSSLGSWRQPPRLSTCSTAAATPVRNPEHASPSQESQRTGYPTDVPVKSYDFQAPLGEFGGERPSFRRLKLTNYFLNDFGDLLAPMAPSFPTTLPATPADLTVPRLSARTSGRHGFLFLNNHLRGETMPARPSFSVDLRLPSGSVQIPDTPITLPPDAYGIWPVNFDLGGGLNLRYSTAQLFHEFTTSAAGSRIPDRYLCFFAIPGVAPELAVETIARPASTSTHVAIRVAHGVTYLRPEDLGQPREIVFHTTGGRVHLLLFSRDQAETLWRIPGQAAPLLTTAQFYADDHTATLESDGKPTIAFATLSGAPKPNASALLTPASSSPLLHTWTAHLTPVTLTADLTPVAAATPRDPLQNGPAFSWRKQPIAMAPEDADFKHAATWTLTLPDTHSPDVSDVRLRIRYNGDVARLRSATGLLDDDFWNGLPWELSLRDLHADGAPGSLTLQVLPWPQDAPMYLEARHPTGPLTTPAIDVIPQYRLRLQLAPE